MLTTLRRMIARKEIDAVFFAALDRIARDPVYQQIVISECACTSASRSTACMTTWTTPTPAG